MRRFLVALALTAIALTNNVTLAQPADQIGLLNHDIVGVTVALNVDGGVLSAEVQELTAGVGGEVLLTTLVDKTNNDGAVLRQTVGRARLHLVERAGSGGLRYRPSSG